MSHVDDGILHAYLDGALAAGGAERAAVEAHLRGCADCRARLEAARAERDSAREILGALEPAGVAAPPFEELVARRRARGAGSAPDSAGGVSVPGSAGSGSGRGPWSSRLVALGWAASVLLALGGGWMARMMFEDPSAPLALRTALEMAEDEADSGRDAADGGGEREASPEAAGTAPAESAERTAGGDVGAAAGRDAPEAMAEAAAVDEAARRARAEVPADAPVAASPADTGGAAVDTIRRAEVEAIVIAPTTFQAQPRPERETPVLLDTTRFRMDSLLTSLVQTRARGTDEARGVAPVGIARVRGTSDPETDVSELAVVVALEVRSAAADRDLAWRAVSPAEAMRALGRPPLELEGLPWERMELADGDGGALLRTIHPLGDDDRVVFLQSRWPLGQAIAGRRRAAGDVEEPARPAAEAAPRPGAEPGVRRVAVAALGEGIAAVLHGLDDRSELEALLARIRVPDVR